MSLATSSSPIAIKTIGDLLNRLGGIPADRVLHSPAPGTATEADFLRANEELGIPCKLIDGTLVEQATGSYESLLAGYLIRLLWNYVAPRKLGIVLATDGMYRLFSGNIRMPDASFVPKERFPGGLPKGPVWKISPTLAVEVLSASNTAAEIDRKRGEFFANGVLVVWVVDPVFRTATIHKPDIASVTKADSDTLDGCTALPGFSLPLSELFGVMDL